MSRLSLPRSIRKRDGSIVGFDPAKIQDAIWKAALEVIRDEGRSAIISNQATGAVLERLARSFKDGTPGIEQTRIR